MMAGCATSDDAASEPGASEPDELAAPAAEDPVTAAADPAQTETAARHPLPAPTISTGGGSTATVTPALDSANVVIDGSAAAAAYAQVTYAIATGAMAATAEVTVNPAPGASFQYLVSGSGGGYSSRHIRIERDPGSDALLAATPSGLVSCGRLASGQPTLITVVFDGTAKTFDVRLAGAATPCSHLATRASGPVTGFRLVDSSIQGYGGHVEFSNAALRY